MNIFGKFTASIAIFRVNIVKFAILKKVASIGIFWKSSNFETSNREVDQGSGAHSLESKIAAFF